MLNYQAGCELIFDKPEPIIMLCVCMFYDWVLRSIEANHKTQELQLLRPIFFLLLVTGIGSTQKMTTMANPEHKVLQSDV